MIIRNNKTPSISDFCSFLWYSVIDVIMGQIQNASKRTVYLLTIVMADHGLLWLITRMQWVDLEDLVM